MKPKALVFLVACSLSLIALAIAGEFGAQEVVVGLTLLPGQLADFLVGTHVRQYLSQSLGRVIMLCIAERDDSACQVDFLKRFKP